MNDNLHNSNRESSAPKDLDAFDRFAASVRSRLGRLILRLELPTGTKIGPFRIVSLLGKGGFGCVYLAEQDNPRRTVALKVLSGAAIDRAAQWVEWESGALGRMAHAAIAQVYQAGVAEPEAGALPYIAMEWIEGALTLSQYAAGQRQTLHQRLELVAVIADGVQHAHDRGVLHLDLKPGNVLLNREGRPKIIDFGIARVSSRDEVSVTSAEPRLLFVGTPPYMSPEQTRGDATVASDIHALGVILYELLIGRQPEPASCPGAPPTFPPISSCATWNRRSGRVFRGDIEAIVRKALQPDPAARYSSAGALAADIHRHLSHRPISIRPQWWYRAAKFLRRHRLLLGAVLAITFAAAIPVGIFGIEARKQAQRSAQREALASQISDVLTNLVTIPAPQRIGERLLSSLQSEARAAWSHSGEGAEAVESRLGKLAESLRGVNATNVAISSLDHTLLARAEDLCDRNLAEYPNFQANLLQAIADIRIEHGLLREAQPAQHRALALRRQALGDEAPETLRSLNNQGLLWLKLARYADAESCFREACSTFRRTQGEHYAEALVALSNLGMALMRLGRCDEAEACLRQVVETRRHELGPDDPHTLLAMGNLGQTLQECERPTDAEPWLRQAYDGLRRAVGDGDFRALMAANNYAIFLRQSGDLPRAETIFREVLEISRRVFGDDHPETLTGLNNLGQVLRARQNYADAERVFRELSMRRTSVFGAEHADSMQALDDLRVVLTIQGHYAEALKLLRDLLERRRRALGDDHRLTIRTMSDVGTSLRNVGRSGEALDFYREAVERARRALPDDPEFGVMLNNLAQLLYDQKDYAAAESTLIEAVQVWRAACGDDAEELGTALQMLGSTQLELKNFDEAAVALTQALAIRQRRFDDDHPQIATTLHTLAIVLSSAGDLTAAEPRFRAALAIRRLQKTGVSPLARTLHCLGQLLSETSDWVAAEPIWLELLEIERTRYLASHPDRVTTQICWGRALLGLRRFEEADAALSAAYQALEGHSHEQTAAYTALHRWMIELFDARHAADATKGYDAVADEWRARLARWQSSTQPAAKPAD